MRHEPTRIALLGAGSVGIALAWLFSEAGYAVSLGTRNLQQAQKRFDELFADQPPAIQLMSPEQAVREADISLLTVSDAAIKTVCEQLAPAFKAGSVVAHCSGALDSHALYSATERGLAVCSLHPLNTFPNPLAALATVTNEQHGTCLYSEGDPAALELCLPLFQSLGFMPVQIDRDAKPLYHAACVFACNYLTVLMDLSMTTAASARIDTTQFWQGLQPLIQTTLTNFAERGAADSLSGPIARGDAQTVSNHLEHLSGKSSHLQLSYAELGRLALRLAEQNGELSKAELLELETVLGDTPPAHGGT